MDKIEILRQDVSAYHKCPKNFLKQFVLSLETKYNEYKEIIKYFNIFSNKIIDLHIQGILNKSKKNIPHYWE